MVSNMEGRMKPIHTVATAALLLALATPVAGQHAARTLGLGIGIQSAALLDDDVGLLAVLSPQVYVPIVVSERLILEPSFGVFRVDQEGEDFLGDPYTYSATLLRLGVGALFAGELGRSGRVYVGPRVGVVRISTEQEQGAFDEESTRTDLALAAVTGGEFFLVDGLSLGGEVGLEWVRIGEEDVAGEPSPAEEKASLLRTTSELRVRWYFR